MSGRLVDEAKEVTDVVAVGAGFAAALQWVPAIAGLLAAIYTGLRIFELIEKRHAHRQWPFRGANDKPDKDQPKGA